MPDSTEVRSILDTPIGVELRLPVTLKISDDEDSKKAGDTKAYTVDFIFDATWTPRQLAERCVNASSARVTFQNTNRGKSTVPSEWKVNKAGTRSTVDVEAAIKAKFAGMTQEQKMAFIAELTGITIGA